MRQHRARLLALALALAACGDGDADAGAPLGDAPEDVYVADTDGPLDTSGASATPVAPAVDLAPLPVDEWLVASLPSASDDPVGDSLTYGSFVTPSLGVDAYGVTWSGVSPSEDGALGPFASQAVYVVAKVTVAETTRVVGRFDNAYAVWLDGRHRQPGEIYGGAEAVRVPLVLDPGEHAIVVAQSRAQRALRVVLEATPDDLHLNLEDLTVPDLLAETSGTQWLGAPVLNLSGEALLGVVARVEASDALEATETHIPALAPGAFTQLAFELAPARPLDLDDDNLTVTLHVESPDLDVAFEREVVLRVLPQDARHLRTFRSPVDASVQYYGVLPPQPLVPGRQYGLILSMHGAADRASDANRWYGPKEWAYVVSPTNRRRYGFDWEEWGHDNALNALADARAAFPIDPARLHATGVSMGGHGTWHMAAMHPDLFATFTPSAGWRSFYSYTGDPEPAGAFARARAHSRTIDYLDNLADASVYIIHGGDDPVVPVREARDMFALLEPLTTDLTYHEEPGAGHFWRSETDDGVNCADWPEAIAHMRDRARELTPLDFTFRSPAAWYSPTYAWATVTSTEDAWRDFTLEAASSPAGDAVTLTTDNVRGLVLDGAALSAAGVATVTVDGDAHALPDGPLVLGPATGKRPGVSGPYSQVFRRPFGFVYPDGDVDARDYCAWLVSTWSAIGNGQAFALPMGRMPADLPTSHNLVFVGFDAAAAPIHHDDAPFDWGPAGVTVGDVSAPHAALMRVAPLADRLHAFLYATPGSAHLLYRLMPLSSRGGMPDYLAWTEEGVAATGFFDADWAWSPPQ